MTPGTHPDRVFGPDAPPTHIVPHKALADYATALVGMQATLEGTARDLEQWAAELEAREAALLKQPVLTRIKNYLVGNR